MMLMGSNGSLATTLPLKCELSTVKRDTNVTDKANIDFI